MSDKELIKGLGGPAKVAELLGFKKHGVQRVQNWTARGIPAQVRLDHPELFPRKIVGREGSSVEPQALAQASISPLEEVKKSTVNIAAPGAAA